MAFPEFDGLFKNLVNLVAINLGEIGLKDKTRKIRSMSFFNSNSNNSNSFIGTSN